MSSDSLKKFYFDYFKDSDYSHWNRKVNHNIDKIRKLKTDRAKKGYIIQLYSDYIQLAEILLTQVYMIVQKERSILEGMFIRNSDLLEFAGNIQEDETFYAWFLDNYIYGIKEKDSIKDYQNKYKFTKEVLQEIIKDFCKDYQFLNSYKHGYRVRGTSKGMACSANMGSGEAVLLARFDSALIYYTREHDETNKNKYIVYENTLGFNHKRLAGKAMIMTTMLTNMQRIILAETNPGQRVILDHHYTTDKKLWNEGFGNARFKSDIFILTKKRKPTA